jgi:hypothetical protein
VLRAATQSALLNGEPYIFVLVQVMRFVDSTGNFERADMRTVTIDRQYDENMLAGVVQD